MLHPDKIILLGIPIKGGAPVDSFVEWLKHITIPVVIVQNTADPLGSFADVKNAFENAGTALTFVELPGETHDYLDFDAIAQLL